MCVQSKAKWIKILRKIQEDKISKLRDDRDRDRQTDSQTDRQGPLILQGSLFAVSEIITFPFSNLENLHGVSLLP